MISWVVLATAGVEEPPVVEGPPEPEEAAVGSLVPSSDAEGQGSQAPVSGHWYPLRLYLGQDVWGPLPWPLPLLVFL